MTEVSSGQKIDAYHVVIIYAYGSHEVSCYASGPVSIFTDDKGARLYNISKREFFDNYDKKYKVGFDVWCEEEDIAHMKTVLMKEMETELEIKKTQIENALQSLTPNVLKFK